MDSVRLNHIGLNGPGLWKILHKMAIYSTTLETKTRFKDFLIVFRECIGCKNCLTDFDNFLKNNPLENYDNIVVDKIDIGYFKWTWQLHNIVNLKLHKQLPILTDAYKKFFNTLDGQCIACINLE